MLSEIIDIFIIGAILLFALLFVFNRIKAALINNNKGMCHGCEGKNCNTKEKQNCNLPQS